MRRENRTLVIGYGFIGQRVTEELLSADEDLTVLTRSRPEKGADPRLGDDRLLVGDAADPGTLASALERVDRVVYAAGGLLPAASEDDPERDEELTLTPIRTLLAALAGRPETRLIYLSSGGTVYGDPERVPVGEDEEPRPRGVYGRLHLKAEGEILAAAAAGDGPRARVLRCSTVYGEGQRPDRGQGVIATFLHRIEAGEPIEVFGDAGTIRDYLYVGDLARVVVALLDRGDGPPVLNVGSGVGTSLAEILELTEAEVGRPANVVRHPERSFDVHRIYLDVARLRELVEVEPTPLAEGIGRTHRWLTALAPERT
jgi:UDP-glucose 4-epimerase